jgi:hypothetical protein
MKIARSPEQERSARYVERMGLVRAGMRSKRIPYRAGVEILRSLSTSAAEAAIDQARGKNIVKRLRIEHGDGNVSYLHPEPMAKPAPIPAPVRLSPAGELRCAFLRWKASMARAEIARARAHGIYVTDTLIEYERQIDRYEQRIAQIMARAAAKPYTPPSLFREVIVGMGMIAAVCLAFHLWSK